MAEPKRLTYAQMAALAHGAGFGSSYKRGKNPQMLATAIAIAHAESGFDPAARHVNSNGSIDVGLWQINSIHFKQLAQSEEDLKNPEQNAAAAFNIFVGNGGGKGSWTPWVTYQTGAYLAFMPQALIAAAHELKTNPHDTSPEKGSASDWTSYDATDAGKDAAGAVSGVKDAVMAVPNFLAMLANPHLWVRVLYVIGGGIILLAGLAILAKELAGATGPTSINPLVNAKTLGGVAAKPKGLVKSS